MHFKKMNGVNKKTVYLKKAKKLFSKQKYDTCTFIRKKNYKIMF